VNSFHPGRLGGQLGVGLCLLGFAVLFFGWNGAASQDYVPAQLPYLISGGGAGLAIVVLGGVLLVVQNQRANRVRLEQALERAVLAIERGATGTAPGGTPEGAGLGRYVITGAMSYHRVDCELPEARTEASMVPLDQVLGTTLAPCRVCNPPHLATPVG